MIQLLHFLLMVTINASSTAGVTSLAVGVPRLGCSLPARRPTRRPETIRRGCQSTADAQRLDHTQMSSTLRMRRTARAVTSFGTCPTQSCLRAIYNRKRRGGALNRRSDKMPIEPTRVAVHTAVVRLAPYVRNICARPFIREEKSRECWRDTDKHRQRHTLTLSSVCPTADYCFFVE
jgi:hypothetical protein